MRIEKMVKLSTVVLASALVFSGCRKTEAELLGYKGRDIKNDARGETTFFTMSPTVTNTLPLRVLSVQEKYELSEGEKALIKDAGIVMPSAPLKAIPAGYAKKFDEPWFVTWAKPAKAFGVDGFCGFVSHYDEESKEWQTGEAYFTSHWPTKEKALELLASLEKSFIEKYAAKKIHKFVDCYAVEYLRLRVICVVGMLPNSKWACMISIQDKNNYGCGQVETVEIQKEMLARYKYDKSMKAWTKRVDEISRLNQEKIIAACAKKGIDRSFGDAKWTKSGEVLHMLCANGSSPISCTGTDAECAAAFDAEWKKLIERASKSFGIDVNSACNEEKFSSGIVRQIVATNELFDVRIEMYCPCEKLAAKPETAAAPETNSADAKAAEKEVPTKSEVACEWNIVATEKMQPGFAVPEKPKAPTFNK
jgi:hypothetical protein